MAAEDGDGTRLWSAAEKPETARFSIGEGAEGAVNQSKQGISAP